VGHINPDLEADVNHPNVQSISYHTREIKIRIKNITKLDREYVSMAMPNKYRSYMASYQV